MTRHTQLKPYRDPLDGSPVEVAARALALLLDIVEMYDAILVGLGEPREQVYSPAHERGMVVAQKAFEKVLHAANQEADCPECGPQDRVDEDGCCLMCGRDAMVYPDSTPCKACGGTGQDLGHEENGYD